MSGKTWLLLPDGFRDQDSGRSYPLPSIRGELLKLIPIVVPPGKTDSGCLYLQRVMEEFKKRQGRKQSAALDLARAETKVAAMKTNTFRRLTKMEAQAREALESVKQQAQEAIASLNDLFSLGRRGIEGQMRSHLGGNEWQGEKISARDFRECFRMVTQAVKGLGLPSEQRAEAEDAIIDQVAESIKAIQDASSLDPSTADEETEH
jgi:hypothetical protein